MIFDRQPKRSGRKKSRQSSRIKILRQRLLDREREREREKKRRKTVKEKGLKGTRQRAQALYKRGALIKSRVLIF